MLSVLEIVRRTTDFFVARGIESPRLNAELLVSHALGLGRMQLYLQFERLLTEPELEKIRPLVRRRGAREPLQYIVGETDFFGLKLKVDKRALIPRPETERLVEIVLERAKPPPAHALDLGTGTGAIALALARAWPQARVTAVDISADALALAQENAAALAVGTIEFVRGSWFEGLEPSRQFGWITANPPYLSDAEASAAPQEVREHEPVAALAALENGLAALTTILRQAPAYLAEGGYLSMETGPGQHEQLRAEATKAGWKHFESLPDLTGRPRFVILG